MPKTIAKVALAAVTLLIAAAGAARGTQAWNVYARPGQLVEVSPGRRLNLRCSGLTPSPGRPTVILESGLGFPSYSWRKVQPAVAKFARVCSYDRAGLGFSDAGPLPRTAGAIADDLARLIAAAGLRPPFVLVGSSLGSQSVRLFAFRTPARVAGLVLVDPYVEGQIQAFGTIDPAILTANAKDGVQRRVCARLLLKRALSPTAAVARGCIAKRDPTYPDLLATVVQRQRMAAASVTATLSESENLETASEADVRAATRPLGAMPITVLTAGGDFAGQGYSAVMERRLLARLGALHQRLAALSTRGRVVVVPNADHVIQASDPQAVIDAIRAMTPQGLSAYSRIN